MSAPEAKTFPEVLREELAAFGPKAEQKEQARSDPIAEAHNTRLAGLAFSGGGIRSATFNLGVLQALADMHLLRKFHYLSTVSGGGYIGSWLTAWIHRRGGRVDEVAQGLRTRWKEHWGEAPEEIRFLRRFSNYLTPKLGWLGADTWTLVAIYLRNVLLNMIALVAGMVFCLALPRGIGVLVSLPWIRGWIAVLFGLLLLLATTWIVCNLLFLQRRQRDVWAGDWLVKGGDHVRELQRPPAANGEEVLSSGEEFGDFVLDLKFKLTSLGGKGRLLLRASKPNEKEKWEVQIGRGVTGKLAGQPPEKWPFEQIEPNEPDRLRIVCIGRNLTARVNGRQASAPREARDVPERGAIMLQQSPGLVVTEILLRPIDFSPWFTRQGWVQWLIVLPFLLAGVLSLLLLGRPGSSSSWIWREMIWWAAIATLVAVIAHAIEFFPEKIRSRRDRKRSEDQPRLPSNPAKEKTHQTISRLVWAFIGIVIGGATGGLVLGWFHHTWPQSPGNFWPRLTWGPPLFIVALCLVLVLYIGLRGADLSEWVREWWSRLGAWLLIYAIFWAAVLALAFYAPLLLEWLAGHLKSALAAISFTWVATTISGLFAAASPATGKGASSPWLGLLAKIAPYVFIIGLLAALSWGVNSVFKTAAAVGAETESKSSAVELNLTVQGKGQPPIDVELKPKTSPAPWSDLSRHHWETLADAHLQPPPGGSRARGNAELGILLLGSFLVAWFLGIRLDINAFSLHMLYRNRLARCYIGAANARLRNPHAFTGFDKNDDINLANLSLTNKGLAEANDPEWDKEKSGPYPILNCALNLVGGSELAWQQRKAASFVFTPKYCGYDFPELPPGFCSTSGTEGTPAYASSRGPLTLATAMTISGAAASPNMGYHSSPAAAFLMTLFNVRLGWWIGNPRHTKTWIRSSPNWALPWLVAEMFGLTRAEGRYIYLSDGGHFENLGIFELVRRRCRFILACDAEQDGNFGFDGLGNAIEKCRTDLGIDIELDVDAIRKRDEHGHSGWHCAVGKIRYDKADPDAQAGTILYLKSSLTGDEPTDVLRYAARVEEFPHESTNDQWFGESQFESYRALGHHIATTAFQVVDTPENLSRLTTERVFVQLEQRWTPASSALGTVFQRRGETLNKLYETLRTEPNLRFLNEQIYPEWRTLVAQTKDAPPMPNPAAWLPEKYEELRAGFYFCNRMIQLMEDVYHDLHLEHEHSHPDNRGWMNLFTHWTWSRMFRVTWTISGANSGARFQSFCQRHLELEVGRVFLSRMRPPDASLLQSVESESLAFLSRKVPGLRGGLRVYLIHIAPSGTDDDGPKFTAGFILLAAGKQAPLAIRYFRVSDHLRRMGVARRALYRLLYDDMRQQVGSARFQPIGLELIDVPPGTPEMPTPEDCTRFCQLYRGVQLELEGVFRNTAKVSRSIQQGAEELRNYWLDEDKRRKWLVVKNPDGSSDSEMLFSLRDLKPGDGELQGKWYFADRTNSPVRVRLDNGEVAVTTYFLPTGTARDEMTRRWEYALDRLAQIAK